MYARLGHRVQRGKAPPVLPSRLRLEDPRNVGLGLEQHVFDRKGYKVFLHGEIIFCTTHQKTLFPNSPHSSCSSILPTVNDIADIPL